MNTAMKSLFVLAITVTGFSSAEAQLACRHVNPRTGDACITQHKTDQVLSDGSKLYHWNFTNSCDVNIDVQITDSKGTESEPTVPAGRLADFVCASVSGCTGWVRYKEVCPDSPGRSNNAARQTPAPSRAPTSSRPAPSERDEVEASLELQQAKSIQQFGSIVKNYPNTASAEQAKSRILAVRESSRIEGYCGCNNPRFQNMKGGPCDRSFPQACINLRTEMCRDAFR
jgi:hypothetical protein